LTPSTATIYEYHEFPSPKALRIHALLLAIAAPLLLGGCASIASRMVADAVSETGTTYARDDDPELVAAAVPFGLKTMEGLLESQPEHQGLLLALTAGFTQYGYAFVQQEADAAELKGRNAESRAARERARKLYLRARDYGLRALDLRHPGLADRLRELKDLPKALSVARKPDVPLLYWTAAAWALAISNGKDRMDLVASLPAPGAMMTRALELDESWDDGAIHEFFVAYDAARSAASGGGVARASEHYRRALELSQGKKLGVKVNFAESVSVQAQDRAEFGRLLREVLASDAEAEPRWRLANTIAQRRARLLLEHAEDLFL
jgi:predicted anti-sigma-YlaC factor YlaD